MIIPWEQLSETALRNIVQSFILREGTDYGVRELSLSEKEGRLLKQIKSGQVVIVWSELHQSLDLKEKQVFLRQAEKNML
ncbi:YheU family protein [Gallibacterium trehalosifermentans]|uniref:YheU family protein n=1 Tax=Gallibacterium trehalosifermentans TaxID=516935 RepID=A0ABV6GZT4_9PAST